MRPRAAWLFVALPVLGVAELGLALNDRGSAPRPEAYDALEPALAELYEDGDLVVVAPRWAEPHARRALGDRYFPLAALGRSDEARFERALEISALGERAPELAAFREVSRRSVGPFVVRVLSNPAPERVVFDFVEHLEPAWVTVGGTEPETRCAWSQTSRPMTGGLGGHPGFPPRRFECPDGPYLNVSSTVIADQDFLPRRCIWAHPTRRGARTLRFNGVPLGQRIVGHSGMYWMIERPRAGAPVDLELRVDGELIGVERHSDGEGWKRFSFELGEHAGKASANVELSVRSEDYRDRHFCFQADTR